MYTVQKVQEDIFMVYLHSCVFFTTYLQFFIPTFPSIYLSCYNLREIGITVGGINQCKSFVFTRKMVDKLLRKMTLRQKNRLDFITLHLYIFSRHLYILERNIEILDRYITYSFATFKIVMQHSNCRAPISILCISHGISRLYAYQLIC